MRARRMPVGVWRIDAGELQRRVTDVDLGVRQHADRFQCGTGVAHARQCRAMVAGRKNDSTRRHKGTKGVLRALV